MDPSAVNSHPAVPPVPEGAAAVRRVAFFGPELSYTHRASRQLFGPAAEYQACESIAEVFAAVAEGDCQLGVAPVENSTEGSVNQTLDLLSQGRLFIRGEHTLTIVHGLVSRAATLAGVREVASHPQALAQCRGWLKRNLPGVPVKVAASTSAAARAAVEDPGLAAVAPPENAAALKLNLLAEAIEDVKPNWTRFLVLGKEPVGLTGRDKTTIMFAAAHRPGALVKALSPLAEAGLNLARIESRPSLGRPWEYLFFVDFMGHAQDPVVVRALAAMAGEVERLLVLGSYPRGDRPREGEAGGEGR